MTSCQVNAALVGPYTGGKTIRSIGHPHMGLHSLAHWAKKFGKRVLVYDPNMTSPAFIAQHVGRIQPPLIGISPLHETLSFDFAFALQLQKASPNSILVLGGHEAMFNAKIFFQHIPHLGIIVKGMGEFAFLDLLQRIDRQGTLLERFGDVTGLLIRSDETPEGFVSTGCQRYYTGADFLNTSNALSFGAIPFNKYWERTAQQYADPERRAVKVMVLNTIRICLAANACNFGCIFCSVAKFWEECSIESGHNLRGPYLNAQDSLEQLIRAQNEQPEVQAFYIEDDDFFFNMPRVEAIVEGIIRAKAEGRLKPDLQFFCQARTRVLSDELLAKMKQAGFTVISFGIEIFSNRLVNELKKASGDTVARSRKAIEACLENGITPTLFLIAFPPTATLQEVEISIDISFYYLIRGAKLNMVPYVGPLPGTEAETLYASTTQFAELDLGDGKIIKYATEALPQIPEVKVLASEAVEFARYYLGWIRLYLRTTKPLPPIVQNLLMMLSVYLQLGKRIKARRVENHILSIISDIVNVPALMKYFHPCDSALAKKALRK